MLDPIFYLLDKLIVKEKETDDYIEEVTAIENTQNEKVNSDVDLYGENEKLIEQTIDNDKVLITDMIRRNLLNPNQMSDEGGEEGEIADETLLITDKLLTDMGYGFVKDGRDIVLAGVTNYGLALGDLSNVNGNYTFLNPKEQMAFPSYKINNILKLSTNFAFISTNNGLIEYDIASGHYIMRTMSYGLNTNQVKKTIPLFKLNTDIPIGYLAGTSKGISFSPTGTRWLNVDESFNDTITCFHSTQKLDEKYSGVFVGTNKGIYFFNSDTYIANERITVELLNGIMQILPSNYINSIAYNTSTDKLYIATNNGITVIDDILEGYLKGNIADSPSYNTFNANHGLSSTLCFDIVIMPSQKLVIATSNGLTITSDFNSFSYIIKKSHDNSLGLESYMCNKLIRKNATSITVLHPIGLTEGIVL